MEESEIDRINDMVRRLESAPTSRAKSIAITHLQTAALWLAQAYKE